MVFSMSCNIPDSNQPVMQMWFAAVPRELGSLRPSAKLVLTYREHLKRLQWAAASLPHLA